MTDLKPARPDQPKLGSKCPWHPERYVLAFADKAGVLVKTMCGECDWVAAFADPEAEWRRRGGRGGA